MPGYTGLMYDVPGAMTVYLGSMRIHPRWPFAPPTMLECTVCVFVLHSFIRTFSDTFMSLHRIGVKSSC